MHRKIVFALFISIFFLSGCSQTQKPIGNNSADFQLGVIQTTQNKNTSYIAFYDEALNFVREKKFEYGDMADTTRSPFVVGTHIYMVPLGLGNSHEIKKVLQYDIKTEKNKLYNINQPVTLSFCADSKNIYTTNTLNFEAVISKCDVATGSIETWKLKSACITKLCICDNNLYAWGFIMGDNQPDIPYMFIFEKDTLKLVKKVLLTGCGGHQYSCLKKNNILYFANNDSDDLNSPGYNLSTYNLKTSTIENIKLQEAFPYQIFDYNNKLYITHCNPISYAGNKLTVYDPKTSEQNLFSLESSLAQSMIYKNQLYSHDGEHLYVYDLKTLKLKKKINICRDRSKDIGIFKKDMKYYIGGFFIYP